MATKISAKNPISWSVVIFCVLSVVQMVRDSNNPLPLVSSCSKHRTVRNSDIATDTQRLECRRCVPLLLPSDRQEQFRTWGIGGSFRYSFACFQCFCSKKPCRSATLTTQPGRAPPIL
jgi:hypothetical protein